MEGNIENGNCYCIRIDYDDNNEEQAGAELGKAQPKLGLGKIKINLALVKSRKVV